ncbi:MAG: VWA domain-containing protein, partial [Gammaproteobacteria bacterium]|nr:VWA domain-containing protein [Gammaproteobacteria bacterium]
MAVLDDLREGDYFNITRFGSNHVTTFPAMVQANEINLQKARHVIRKMSADLGGTEMEEALDQVYAIPHPQGIKADILLVTDGEVYQHESIIESWSTRETRVFTVGIGDQVSEVLLQDLARTTNAVCELAVLNEKIEPAIMAQFKRIGQPRINKLEIKWPDGMIPETLSLPKAVFANDAFWINAQFKQAPNGPVAIELALDSGETLQQGAIISTFPENTAVPISTVARLAAGDRMARTDDEEVVQSIAVSYQLMSTKTNYIFVDVRENKLDDLPEMRKVGQMMPSGWAAAGAPIAASMDSMSDMVDFGFKECLAPMEETRAAPPTRSRFPDLQRKSMAPPDKFPTPDTEMFGFDDEIIVIGIPDFLTRLAQEFGNPKDLIAAGSYPEHMLPDELQNYILAQVQAQASGMEALLQAVIYLANKYSDRLDKQTNRFYSKLAKTFQPAMDLSQSLQVYFP